MKLEAKGLTKEFYRRTKDSNRFVAVDSVDIALEPGTLTVLTGRSGSGKTTLLNMLCGLLAPTKGSVLLDGEDLYLQSDRRLSQIRNQKMGIMPQGQTALGSLSVLQNVLLPYTIMREDGDEQRARELLERLGIGQLAGARPQELSGGELRRMSAARALIRSPGLLFADEPTADLDDANTAALFGFLRDTARSGAAVLVITHENDAAAYADVLLKMDGGRLAQP